MSGTKMEHEDLIAHKNAYIGALEEELQRERLWRTALQEEADLTFEKLVQAKKEVEDLKAKMAAWLRIAEHQAELKEQIVKQAFEL
jgi:hypothetical protein